MTPMQVPAIVPRISTPRLLLREVRPSEFDVFAGHMTNPEEMPFGMVVADRRKAWRGFCSMMGHWVLTGAGWWGVALADSGALIGQVGAFFRETQFHLGPDADIELGWVVFGPYRRHGYATEAARAALDFGFANHPAKRAVAYLHIGNEASASVCRAIGMTSRGEVDFYGEPAALYAIERGEWEKPG